MDGLYAIHDDSEFSYFLSSIIADAMFTEYKDIDAIMFPSLQQRFGINVSFNEEAADNLEIDFTCVNQITKIFKTGNYQYNTYLECTDFTNNILKYKTVSESTFTRVTYR